MIHGIGGIRFEDMPEPKIEQPTGAAVRITASDLRMIRGTMGQMVPGTIFGHEVVGVVEEIGRGCVTWK